MLGELYEDALTGLTRPEIEYADGRRTPLRIDDWLHAIPGDSSILDRCQGPTLDVGSGPGRLTVALAERGVPVLGIDITPAAVQLARSSGALALHRDVFATVPGTGRWSRVLLADGNAGIGGDPDALLSRVGRTLIQVGEQAWTSAYRDDVAAELAETGWHSMPGIDRAVLVLVLIHSVAIPRSRGTALAEAAMD